MIHYMHLSSICVETGDVVSAGELIGYSGASGNVTGAHLHIDINDIND